MTVKSRRKPPRVLFLPRLAVTAGLGFVLALSSAGFVFYTKITLEKQAYFAPESAHPWDGYAAFSLFFCMVSGAGLLLSLRDPAPMRWRRGRASKQMAEQGKAKGKAKRRRSGTIKPNDTR